MITPPPRPCHALGFCRYCNAALTALDVAPYGPGGGECVACAIDSAHDEFETDEAETLAETLHRGLAQAGRVS